MENDAGAFGSRCPAQELRPGCSLGNKRAHRARICAELLRACSPFATPGDRHPRERPAQSGLDHHRPQAAVARLRASFARSPVRVTSLAAISGLHRPVVIQGAASRSSTGRARDLAIRRHCSRLAFITRKTFGKPRCAGVRRGAGVDHRRNRPEMLIVPASLTGTIASC